MFWEVTPPGQLTVLIRGEYHKPDDIRAALGKELGLTPEQAAATILRTHICSSCLFDGLHIFTGASNGAI